jgi:hypothetical protein
MNNVFHGARDFSDMYIKEEPVDPTDMEDAGEIGDTQAYRNDVKIEMESDEGSDEECGGGRSELGDDDTFTSKLFYISHPFIYVFYYIIEKIL